MRPNLITRIDYLNYEKLNYHNSILYSIIVLIVFSFFYLSESIFLNHSTLILLFRSLFLVISVALLLFFLLKYQSTSIDKFAIIYYCSVSIIVYFSLFSFRNVSNFDLNLEVIGSLFLYFLFPNSLKIKILGSCLLLIAIFTNINYLNLNYTVDYYYLIFFISNSIGIATSYLITDYRKKLYMQLLEKELYLQRIETAKKQVLELTGIIPLCSSCNKIKIDDSYWEVLHIFLEKNNSVKINYSICENCSEEKIFDE